MWLALKLPEPYQSPIRKSSMTTLPSSEQNNSCTDEMDETGELHQAMQQAMEGLRNELAAEQTDQKRLSAHLKQKLLTLEEELGQSHRQNEEQAGRESSLKKQVSQKDAALAKARQKIQTFESLNKDLDQAVADLQLDLAGTKSREEAHHSRMLALKQELSERDSALRDLRRKADAEVTRQKVRTERAEADAKQAREELLASQQAREALQGNQADLEKQVTVALSGLKQECTKIETISSAKNEMEASFRQQVSQLEDELATVKIAHNSDQLAIAALQQQVVELEREFQIRQEELDGRIASEAALQGDLRKMKEQLDEASSEQSALQQALERQSGIEVELHSKASSLKAALDEAEERHRSDSSQNLALEREVAQLETEISSLRMSMKTLEDKTAAQDESHQLQIAEGLLLQNKLQEASAQLAQATMTEEMQQELISRLQGTLSTSEVDLSQSRTDLAAQEALKSRLQEDLVQLQEDATQGQKLIKELRSQLMKSEDELSVANTAFQTLQSMEGELRKQLGQRDQSIAETRNELKLQERSLANQLEAQLKETMSELSAVRSEFSSQEQQMLQEGLQSELAAAVETGDLQRQEQLALQALCADKEGVIASLEEQSAELKAQLELLSTKLLASQQAVDTHSDRATELQLRISTLEEELAFAQKEGESLQGLEADLKSNLAQKDVALLDALASSEARRANEAALRSALQHQEKLLADERVAKDTAERQLLQSTSQLASLQEELAEIQMIRDEQSGLNQTLQSQLRSSEGKQLRKRITSALRRAADAHHASIELEIARTLQRREPKEARLFLDTQGRVPTGYGVCLNLQLPTVVRQGPWPLATRKVVAQAEDSHETSGSTYLVSAMLQTLLQRLSTRRWRTAQELEGLLEQVKSTLLLRDAEPTGGSGSDLDELVAERLELDIQLLAREVALLRASNVLDDVPWSVVKALAIFSGIILPRDGKEEPFPMHWAADHGRRDIMEFLLRYPAGEDLLLQRDNQGRIPLFYAERAGNESKMHKQNLSQRPSGSSDGIPEAYLRVMQQIDQIGWDKMCWGRGFTLLHWAAKHVPWLMLESCQALLRGCLFFSCSTVLSYLSSPEHVICV
eukprot:Skav213901  [mRNA]  locus=scaffold1439:75331:87799:- [translate_table: standard]